MGKMGRTADHKPVNLKESEEGKLQKGVQTVRENSYRQLPSSRLCARISWLFLQFQKQRHGKKQSDSKRHGAENSQQPKEFNSFV